MVYEIYKVIETQNGQMEVSIYSGSSNSFVYSALDVFGYYYHLYAKPLHYPNVIVDSIFSSSMIFFYKIQFLLY